MRKRDALILISVVASSSDVNPLRPPPSLTTPPVMALPPSSIDVRLPTQPLDLDSVKNIANKMTANIEAKTTTSLLREIRAKGTNKKPFVRPFEDDYGRDEKKIVETPNSSTLATILNNNNNIVMPLKKAKKVLLT